MTNLPVPNPITGYPGLQITGALWNAQIRDGLNFLLNPPFFSAYLAAVPSLTSGTNTKLSLDTVEVDPYGGWDNVNFQWIAPVSGWYEIKGGCGFTANATGQRVTWITVNGTLEAKSYVSIQATSAGSTNFATKTYHRFLNSSDTVSLFAQQNSGGGLTTTNAPFLQLRWVHQ